MATRMGSLYEDAVLCSQSIAPRQTCARPRSLSLWTLVSCSWGGRKKGLEVADWAVEGERGILWTFTLRRLSPSQHTHAEDFSNLSHLKIVTHTRTHTRTHAHTHTQRIFQTFFISRLSHTHTHTHTHTEERERKEHTRTAVYREC